MDGERIIQAISQGGKLLMRESSAVLLDSACSAAHIAQGTSSNTVLRTRRANVSMCSEVRSRARHYVTSKIQQSMAVKLRHAPSLYYMEMASRDVLR
eukprot:1143688-Amphidinium_carterae.1